MAHSFVLIQSDSYTLCNAIGPCCHSNRQHDTVFVLAIRVYEEIDVVKDGVSDFIAFNE